MAGFDIFGVVVLAVLTILDALRGAIRVIGGILAFLLACWLTYMFYPLTGAWVLDTWNLPPLVAFLVGGGALFFLSWLSGLFLFVYLLRRLARTPADVEEEGIHEADEDSGNKPDPVEAIDEGVHEIAHEVELVLWDHLAGALLGFVKGVVVIWLALLTIQVLPFGEGFRQQVGQSFFGKLYWAYVAPTLERQSPELKVIHHMNEVMEIAEIVAQNPRRAKQLKKDPALQKLLEQPKVRKFLEEREDFLRWAKDHPLEALRDPQVRALLQDPQVRRAIGEIHIEELLRRLKK